MARFEAEIVDAAGLDDAGATSPLLAPRVALNTSRLRSAISPVALQRAINNANADKLANEGVDFGTTTYAPGELEARIAEDNRRGVYGEQARVQQEYIDLVARTAPFSVPPPDYEAERRGPLGVNVGAFGVGNTSDTRHTEFSWPGAGPAAARPIPVDPRTGTRQALFEKLCIGYPGFYSPENWHYVNDPRLTFWDLQTMLSGIVSGRQTTLSVNGQSVKHWPNSWTEVPTEIIPLDGNGLRDSLIADLEYWLTHPAAPTAHSLRVDAWALAMYRHAIARLREKLMWDSPKLQQGHMWLECYEYAATNPRPLSSGEKVQNAIVGASVYVAAAILTATGVGAWAGGLLVAANTAITTVANGGDLGDALLGAAPAAVGTAVALGGVKWAGDLGKGLLGADGAKAVNDFLGAAAPVAGHLGSELASGKSLGDAVSSVATGQGAKALGAATAAAAGATPVVAGVVGTVANTAASTSSVVQAATRSPQGAANTAAALVSDPPWRSSAWDEPWSPYGAAPALPAAPSAPAVPALPGVPDDPPWRANPWG